MKKAQSISILLALALTAALFFAGCALFGGGGAGKRSAEPDDRDTSWYDPKSKETTFSISSEKQLEGLVKLTRAAKNAEDFSGKTIVLAGDIDLDGINWTPIGTFRGTFDGKGYSISNLSVSGADIAGLFGQVEMGQIKNLVVNVQKIETKKGSATSAGGLVGYGLNITIENCGVNIADSITAYSEKLPRDTEGHTAYAGGLVGWIDGPMTTSTINNSYVVGNVSAVSGANGANASGGLVGNIGLAMFKVTLNINNSYFAGSVSSSTADSNTFCGGILGCGGIFEAAVKNSYANATVNTAIADTKGGRSQPYFGGIFGRWAGGTNTSVYYNSTKVTSQKINSGVRDGAMPEGITALADADMKRQASFAGFDFSNVWAIEASYNGGYPYLRWQKK
jgi:hypothetical protein